MPCTTAIQGHATQTCQHACLDPAVPCVVSCLHCLTMSVYTCCAAMMVEAQHGAALTHSQQAHTGGWAAAQHTCARETKVPVKTCKQQTPCTRRLSQRPATTHKTHTTYTQSLDHAQHDVHAAAAKPDMCGVPAFDPTTARYSVYDTPC